ncbi:MAG: DedA family protein [Ignavibacteriae bacterium]|nr:DedA family protein [Ignavibacteria bacterium]MBI3364894.1 DedA family protein [Ignavibacteriota bacterium]
MEFLQQLLDFALHIDVHLNDLIITYGLWSYAILFAIIFCETGLVIAPFLPGDSLLFAVGAFAAKGSLDSMLLFILLSAAAILGNVVNYWIGYMLGPNIIRKKNGRFINRAYLERAHQFYEKHGGKAIVIARFLPILRTFAPFVAGIGFMNYGKFMFFNVIAGIVWVAVFVFGGYFFGNLPAVKNNFSLVIGAIVLISMLPAVFEFIRHKVAQRRQPTTTEQR